MALLGGGSLNLPTLVQRIVLDHSGIDTAQIDTKLGSIAASTNRLGKAMTVGVTLPITAAGVAAVHFASDFETAMTQSVALAGVGADQIDGLKASVLELAGKTAKAPQELADAFYFVASAGFSGAEALDVLEASAKASAAGLGDTGVIADAVTSAINAYGKENLTAAQATDVLVKSVQVGKLEADELAPVLGRLVPITSAMGVEFDEAAALLAVFSKTGVDAAEGVTALRGILSQLASPTQQARELLGNMGLTIDDLRKTLKDKGVLALIEELRSKFGGNVEQLSILFPEIRGLIGLLNALGQDAGGVAKVFDEVKNSAGATDAAFATMSETTGFKTKQAMADLQSALIQVGDALLPVVAGLADFISTIAQGFVGLPKPVQEIVVALGAMLALAGPALIFFSKLVQAFIALRDAKIGEALAKGASNIGNLVGSAAAGGPILLGFAAAIGVGAVALFNWNKHKQEAAKFAKEFTDAIIEDTKAVGDNTVAIGDNARAVEEKKLKDRGQIDDLGRLGEKLRNGKSAWETYSEAIEGNVLSAQQFRKAAIDSGEVVIKAGAGSRLTAKDVRDLTNAWIEQGGSIQDLRAEMFGLGTANTNVNVTNQGLVDTLNESTAAFQKGKDGAQAYIDSGLAAAHAAEAAGTAQADLATNTDAATSATGDAGAAMQALGADIDPTTGKARELVSELDAYKSIIDRILGVNLDVESSFIAYEDALANVTDTVKENGNTLDISTQKGRDNRKAMVDATQSALDLAEAFVTQSGDAESANFVLATHAQRLYDTAVQAGLSEDAALDYTASLLGIPPDRKTEITSTADIARIAVEEYQSGIDNLPREKNTTLTVTANYVGFEREFTIRNSAGETIRVRQHGGRVLAGQPTLTGETGTELFMPHVSGSVISSQRLQRLLNGTLGDSGAGGAGNTYETNVYPARASIDEHDLDRIIRRREALAR